MEALNTKSLNSAYKRHKTIDFAEWEWFRFSDCFVNRPVEKQGTVTLCVNHLDGSKESCKVKTKKSTLQFTTSDDLLTLKPALGSTITVSTQNGFPTAPKWLRAADDCLFSKQTAGDSEYINAILPDDENDNSLMTKPNLKFKVSLVLHTFGVSSLKAMEIGQPAATKLLESNSCKPEW
jgi:hypothetical protein